MLFKKKNKIWWNFHTIFSFFFVRKTAAIILMQYKDYSNRNLGYSGGFDRFFESLNEKFAKKSIKFIFAYFKGNLSSGA